MVPHFALLWLRACLYFYDTHFLKFKEEKHVGATWFLLPAQELSCKSSVLLKSGACTLFFLNPGKSGHMVYTGKVSTANWI